MSTANTPPAEAKPAAEQTPPPPAEKPPEPRKIELTEAELEERVSKAVTAAADKARKDAEKAARDAAAERAKADGDVAKQLEATAAERDALKAEREQLAREVRSLKVSQQLRDHLAATHADYVGNAVDILPHVERQIADDTTEAQIARLIEKESAAFAERNPRAPKGGGAPAAVAGRISPAPAHQPPPANGDRRQRLTMAF